MGIHEQRYAIRAQMHIMDGYSGHAYKKLLPGFFTRMRQWSHEIRIAHEDKGAKSRLGRFVSLNYRARTKEINVIIPEQLSAIRQPLNE